MYHRKISIPNSLIFLSQQHQHRTVNQSRFQQFTKIRLLSHNLHDKDNDKTASFQSHEIKINNVKKSETLLQFQQRRSFSIGITPKKKKIHKDPTMTDKMKDYLDFDSFSNKNKRKTPLFTKNQIKEIEKTKIQKSNSNYAQSQSQKWLNDAFSTNKENTKKYQAIGKHHLLDTDIDDSNNKKKPKLFQSGFAKVKKYGPLGVGLYFGTYGIVFGAWWAVFHFGLCVLFICVCILNLCVCVCVCL